MREVASLPLVLRCIKIDNLLRLAVRVGGSQLRRRDADEVADALEAADRQTPPDLSGVLRDIAEHSLSRAFAVQLIQRLRYRDLHLPDTLRALNERLTEQGVTWERLIQLEHASQSAANLTVRNLVTSMRAMSAFDWQAFFEDVSRSWTSPQGCSTRRRPLTGTSHRNPALGKTSGVIRAIS
jgi:cyclic beta-1,2-glucan synthetase